MDRSWRLVLDCNHTAAHNMGLDEAILRAHASGDAPATVRLYGWRLPAISLGHFQNLDDALIDLAYCQRYDVEIVRRMTGGRAVLHGHDLTFSIVASECLLPPECRGVRSSHRWLMAGIAAALRSLGLNARVGSDSAGRAAATSADCFAHAAACDVCAEGVKLAGAAQVRKDGVIMEQGSIPYSKPKVDRRRIFPGEAYSPSPEPLPTHLDRRLLENAVIAGLASSLGVSLLRATLSVAEQREAAMLVAEKYGCDAWTWRRDCASVDNRSAARLY